MANDQHGGPSPSSNLPKTRVPPRTPDNHTKSSSYETGESSATGSLRGLAADTSSSGKSQGLDAGDSSINLESSPSSDPRTAHDGEHPSHDGRSRRRNKARSGGGFLLQDAVAGDREHVTRLRARSLIQQKGKAAPRTPERARPGSHHASASKGYSELASGRAPAISRAQKTQTNSGGSPPSQTRDHALDSSPASSAASQGQDVDAAQIVSMALNLSESRRIASRRIASTSNPPQLAPLPDSGSRSNLRQHFQQQRKNSRTVSPKPNQHSSPRISSGFRTNSPLQNSMMDAGQDGRFRYQFSASTLARAQKAKDHLELLAEYRRLLEYLPPLQSNQEQHLLMSPPGSPALGPRGARSRIQSSMLKTGRPYNPLQYVRNRKVRARERKVIDGEQMGFGDVATVRNWVDRLAEAGYAASANQGNASFLVPEFPGADDAIQESGTDASAKQALRVKRPRVDWFFDPCDMVADAYWLEQDHHKQLIEDRRWRKIFPPPQTPSRPISRQVEDGEQRHNLLSVRTHNDAEDISELPDARLVHTDEGAQGGTRERAKQKLHDIRGFHHRHNSSIHGHDFLRMRRESMSDVSGNEADSAVNRRGRRDTITSDANDLLQKQMRDILARETREKELENVRESEAERQTPSEPASSERKASTQAASQSHSRKTSVVDFSDSGHKTNPLRGRVESPPRHRRGRPSLDIPVDSRRGSMGGWNHSGPTSPRAETKDPFTGGHADLTLSMPSSRSGSPTKNPLSKVKRKFRDRSLEPDLESQSEEENGPHVPASAMEPPYSPLAKITTRPTDESHKSHRSSNSMRMREDQAVGLRGLFKGPRIDNVIRGGVSKLGDMLWRRDNEASSSEETTDESDVEGERGRSRQSMTLSRRASNQSRDETPLNAKHFFDEMPEFRHVSEMPSRSSQGQTQLLNAPEITRPQSRQSARWERLKPPKIDVRGASPDSSPVEVLAGREGGVETSDVESGQPSVPDGVRKADERLNTIMDPSNSYSKSRSQSRHWSITDTNGPVERTHLSKREIIRVRALILSSGLKAMEIKRRATAVQRPFSSEMIERSKADPRCTSGVNWAELAKLTPDDQDLNAHEVSACEVYPLASRVLNVAIQASSQRWQASADNFTTKTSPDLQKRIWEVRSRLADDLSNMTRLASDEADETNKELALDQPLKIKHVNDVIDKLLRNRRRRFRWLRRGLWLTVEWLLVGFMWYVWFVVMILRVFLGIGKGLVNGVRWVLWL